MREINVEPLEIILEPEGRNTAPAITIAALKVLDIFKDKDIEPILLILSSDHQIKDIKKIQYCDHVVVNEKNFKILKENLSNIISKYE